MSTGIKWGIIGGVGWTASLSTMLATSRNAEPQMQLVYLVVGITIFAFSIFLGLRSYKIANKEFNFEKGIRQGLQIVVVASVLMMILLFAYLQYINPEVIENYRELLAKGIEASSMDIGAKKDSLAGIEKLTSAYHVVKSFLPRVVLAGATFVIVSTFLLRKLHF